MKKVESLQNKLLVAMPALVDPYFSRAVIYVYEHDQNGATGFIINKPTNITVGEVLNYTDIACHNDKSKLQPMLLGGPVKQEQLFLILYDREENRAKSHFSLSHSKELMNSINAHSEQDNNMMAFLGYAAWEPGQLERELQENAWLITSANYDLLYKVPFSERYDRATSLMGFNFNQLSGQIGHA